MDVTIRRAEPTDIPQVRTVLALGLSQDPFLRWLLPGDDERRDSRLAMYFADQAERFVLHGLAHVALLAGDVAGAALWAPQRMARRDTLPRPPELAAILCGPDRAVRSAEQFSAARAGAPQCDGPYLATLAVHPQRQGRRIGTQLVLAGHEALGEATWLESCNPRNVVFYQRLGYRVVHQAPLADATTTFTRLARPAAQGSAETVSAGP